MASWQAVAGKSAPAFQQVAGVVGDGPWRQYKMQVGLGGGACWRGLLPCVCDGCVAAAHVCGNLLLCLTCSV